MVPPQYIAGPSHRERTEHTHSRWVDRIRESRAPILSIGALSLA